MIEVEKYQNTCIISAYMLREFCPSSSVTVVWTSNDAYISSTRYAQRSRRRIYCSDDCLDGKISCIIKIEIWNEIVYKKNMSIKEDE